MAKTTSLTSTPEDRDVFARRLKKVLELLGVEQNKFAESGRVSKQTVSAYLKGKSQPAADVIANWVRDFRINANWLLDGIGEPLTPEGHNPSAGTMAAPAPQATAEDWKMSDMLTKTATVLESDTIYRTALASNINAFHQAVQSERMLARLEERVATLEAREERWAQFEARMEELEKENAGLKRRLERQDENTAKAVGADG